MSTKVAVLGASGNIGSAILKELSSRGKYEVVGIARNASKIDSSLPNVKAVGSDASKPEEVVSHVQGINALISALHFDVPPTTILDIARKSGAARVIIVGGAGSLLVAENGPRLIDTPEFPEEFKSIALQGVKFYDQLRTVTDYDWTFFSPPAQIGPGPKLGQFRLSHDILLTDENGDSKISYDDYAIALVDELQKGDYLKKRFTAAY